MRAVDIASVIGVARNANLVGAIGFGVNNCSRRSPAHVTPGGVARRSETIRESGRRLRSAIAADMNFSSSSTSKPQMRVAERAALRPHAERGQNVRVLLRRAASLTARDWSGA